MVRSRSARIAILAIFVAIILLHTVVIGRLCYFSTYWYGDVGVGDQRGDVLYGLGVPKQILSGSGSGSGWQPARGPDPAASAWGYIPGPGTRLEIIFDRADDRVGRIACFNAEAEPYACQSLYGIGLGTSEEKVIHTLGAPGASSMAGEIKTLIYPEIGVELKLRRYAVVSVALLREQTGGFGRVVRFFHVFTPW